jgi:phosphoglucomutase
LAVRNESVASIVTSHWQRFGRNFYTRHDYEDVDADRAAELMEHLRRTVGSLAGRQFGVFQVEKGDDFSYTDSGDNSVSQQQGIRILFQGGGRIVYRLSGTGTQGATLRVYVENHEPNPKYHHQDPQTALAQLIQIADTIAGIHERTGRTAPSVIT